MACTAESVKTTPGSVVTPKTGAKKVSKVTQSKASASKERSKNKAPVKKAVTVTSTTTARKQARPKKPA